MNRHISPTQNHRNDHNRWRYQVYDLHPLIVPSIKQAPWRAIGSLQWNSAVISLCGGISKTNSYSFVLWVYEKYSPNLYRIETWDAVEKNWWHWPLQLLQLIHIIGAHYITAFSKKLQSQFDVFRATDTNLRLYRIVLSVVIQLTLFVD